MGMLTTSLSRGTLVSLLQESGWRLLSSDEEESLLHQSPITLILESDLLTNDQDNISVGSPILLRASYAGEPLSIQPLIDTLARLADGESISLEYSLDLFGDAARLVRRFIG